MNPIEHCNAIFSRSDNVLEKPEENVDEQVEVTHMPSAGGENEKESKGQDEEPNSLAQVRIIDHLYHSLNVS